VANPGVTGATRACVAGRNRGNRLAHWSSAARLPRKRCGAPRCMRSRGPALHIRSACGRVAPTARSTFCAAVRPSRLVASRGLPRLAPLPGLPGSARWSYRRPPPRHVGPVVGPVSQAVGVRVSPAARRSSSACTWHPVRPRRRRGLPLLRRRRSPSGGPGGRARCGVEVSGRPPPPRSPAAAASGCPAPSFPSSTRRARCRPRRGPRGPTRRPGIAPGRAALVLGVPLRSSTGPLGSPVSQLAAVRSLLRLARPSRSAVA